MELAVEGVMAVFVKVMHGAEGREDEQAANDIDIGHGLLRPGSRDGHGRGIIAVFGCHCLLVALPVQRHRARGKQVISLVDDDVRTGWCCEESDRMIISVHPGSAARAGPGASNQNHANPTPCVHHRNLNSLDVEQTTSVVGM